MSRWWKSLAEHPVAKRVLVALPMVVGIAAWIGMTLQAEQVRAQAATHAPRAVAVLAAPLLADAERAKLPAPGSLVPYAALERLTGRHVDVATRHGTLRKGTLRLAGPLALDLELDEGLRLTMPRDTIQHIRYTPPATPAPSTAAFDKAGTHAQEN